MCPPANFGEAADLPICRNDRSDSPRLANEPVLKPTHTSEGPPIGALTSQTPTGAEDDRSDEQGKFTRMPLMRSVRTLPLHRGVSLRLLKFSGGSVDAYAICRSS